MRRAKHRRDWTGAAAIAPPSSERRAKHSRRARRLCFLCMAFRQPTAKGLCLGTSRARFRKARLPRFSAHRVAASRRSFGCSIGPWNSFRRGVCFRVPLRSAAKICTTAAFIPAAIRKRIGLIHQRPVPFPMSILDDVLFGARYHGLLNGAQPVEYARHYLEQVGLWNEVKDRLRERAERLSGGQQQRLCLARTLANQPEVILMDEPCSSLDPAATQQIEELVLGLKPRYTIVIVTHNLAQARRVSDRAIFMLDGEIIEQGSTAEIFMNPQSQLTRDFVSGQIG